MSMMYATSTTSMTSGSSLGVGCAGERRVRGVRLVRPRRAAPAFGFSVRGGKEFATGFYVSHVEPNSIAHSQGLKVGDQVMSVNGYRVEDAVHSELVHYLSTQSQLKLLVKHVGMLPVKENEHEGVTWQVVGAARQAPRPAAARPAPRAGTLRLTTLVPPKAKLGCGICKGPEWKPGIFVQFVRENGIAREAGLRPGDQILSCNGLDFADITFNQAVSALKTPGRLEVVVRAGGGAELVSPESSGYNSSASSAGGEPCPATLTHYRPCANRMKRRTWDSTDFNFKVKDKHNFDSPSDIEPDYDEPSIPNNPHTFENKYKQNCNELFSSPSNRTIINLTEDGATIECSYNKPSLKKSTSSDKITHNDNRKTIVLEIHHNTNNEKESNLANYSQSSKTNSNNDSRSVSSSSTLSSAIADEILKRKINKKNKGTTLTDEKKNTPPSVDGDKRKQHDALIDEFKKVHRKMFPSQRYDMPDVLNNRAENDRHRVEKYHPNNVLCEPPKGISNGKRDSRGTPPTPPPMPKCNNGDSENNEQQNSKNISNLPREVIKNTSNNLARTPTPDYNRQPNIIDQLKILKFPGEKAELESQKLIDPLHNESKQAPNYFLKATNGTSTLKKLDHPVSVTIGEYANGVGSRRQPSKLEFLKGSTTPDGANNVDVESISSRLQSELALTLSRSNLKKKTETSIDAGR